MRPVYRNMTVQVLVAAAIGVCVGHFWPDKAVMLKPLSDGFIKLVRMVVAPVVFLTVVGGIASSGEMRKVGRVGLKALLYFEVVTTAALAIGLWVANVLQPGRGFSTAGATTRAVAQYAEQGRHQGVTEFLLNVIPESMVGALAKGELLPVLFLAVLFGVALAGAGERAAGVRAMVEQLTTVVFRMVGIVMRVAPLGALGAMAFTVGSFGIAALASMAKLMGCVYLTMGLFVAVVLGTVARACGFGIVGLVVAIREELLLVLGTSTSESALPGLMRRLEGMGCSKGLVGLVVPTGYSFNLDGTSIYLSMAVLFIAQAYGIHLSAWEQLKILAVLLLTSKGAAAVTGGGFITLAATLSATHVLPVEGLALLLGVDRFMSEARALTNLVGNATATLVVARMEGERFEVA